MQHQARLVLRTSRRGDRKSVLFYFLCYWVLIHTVKCVWILVSQCDQIQLSRCFLYMDLVEMAPHASDRAPQPHPQRWQPSPVASGTQYSCQSQGPILPPTCVWEKPKLIGQLQGKLGSEKPSGAHRMTVQQRLLE